VPEWSLAVIRAGDVYVWVYPAGVDNLPSDVYSLALVATRRLDVLPTAADLVAR
jgi:hypothetical protein